MEHKTLTRTIGEGVFWFSSSNMLLKIVGLATTFFVLRHLSIYEYGLVTLVLSVVPIFGVFLLPGLADVIISDMGVEKGKGNIGRLRNIFSNYIILNSLLAVLAWALVFFGSDIIARFYQGQANTLLKIISFSFLISPVRTAFGIVFTVYYKFATHSVYLFLEEFFKLLLILVAFFVIDMGTSGVILASVLSQVFAVLIVSPVFFSTYKKFSNALIHDPQPVWSIVRFHRKWNVFLSYFGRSSTKLRLWIIKFILGTEAVAIYSIAESLIGHAVSPISMNRVLKPVIAQYSHQKDKFLKIIEKAVKYQLLGFIGMGLIAFITFPYIVNWFFPNYVLSISLFNIMLLSFIPNGLVSILPSVFFALKAQKKLFYIVIARTVISLSILPLLLLIFGISGAAYEFVIVVFIGAVLRYKSLKKTLPGFRFKLNNFLKIDDYDLLILRKVSFFIRKALRLV